MSKVYKRKKRKIICPATIVNRSEAQKTECRPEYAQQAFIMCSEFGATRESLGNAFDVNIETVDKWLRVGREMINRGEHRSPVAQFALGVQAGRDMFNVEKAEKSLIRKACGFEYEEVETTEIEMTDEDMKRLGISEDDMKRLKGKRVTRKLKQRPPDTQALMFLLQNRAPHRWRNTRFTQSGCNVTLQGFVNHQLADNVKIDLSRLSDEELDVLEKISESSDQRTGNFQNTIGERSEGSHAFLPESVESD